MSADPGLVCLTMLARLHATPADPAQLRHELGLGEPSTAADLLRAAGRLKLKAKIGPLNLDRAAATQAPLPCIVLLNAPAAQTDPAASAAGYPVASAEANPAASVDGAPSPSATADPAAAPRTALAAATGAAPLPEPSLSNTPFAILAKVENGLALLHDPVEARPIAMPVAALQARMTGQAIFVTSRAQLAGELARFDFSWFIPAIVKYRRLLTEAVVASLFLQLFALMTPLFFQVVMDKVLVHKGTSTLTVISIGLLAVVIFESVLSALRNYVFAHTTSRIDVELGTQLFRHLLSLPLAYFEARRVGDSVARVRELENIRQFLTGQALTSIIDLAFTVVFLAVMLYYSPILTLVVALSIPCYIILMAAAMPVFRKRLNEKFTRGAENQSFLVESVTNLQTLKAGAVEPQAMRRWNEQLAGYVASSFRVTRLSVMAGEAIQLIQKLVTVGILWLGAYEVIDGAMTVGALVAFNMLAGRVSQPVIRLAQLWQELQQTGISMARLGDILTTRP